MMVNWLVYRTKSASFWIITLLSTFLYVAFLLKFESYRKQYPESYPTFLEITDQTKRLANTVQVGLHIKTFPEFSIAKGTFVLDALVWFRFAASTEALNTLENFTIQNSQLLDSKGMMHKSKPIVKLLGDDVLVAYNVQLKFQSALVYKKYPLENHRVNITLVNETVTPQQLVFTTKSNYLTLSNEIMVEDWIPVNVHAQSGYLQSSLDKQDPKLTVDYPCVGFSIDFDRVGSRSLTSLYFPLFVLFIIGLLSLMINILDIARLGMISASLPMLVLYRLVIDANFPAIAYATHIDVVFYSLVLLSLPILIFQIYVAFEAQRINKISDEKDQDEAKTFLEKINTLVFISILISLVVLMTYNFLR